MKQVLRFNKVIKSIIILGDLCLLNIVFILSYSILDSQTLGRTFASSLPQLLVLLNLTYFVCNYNIGVVLHRRFVRPERIVVRCLRNVFLHAAVFISLLGMANFGVLSVRFFVLFYTSFLLVLIVYRLIFRIVVKQYRRSGGNSRTTLLIGTGEGMAELYHKLTDDPTSGFRIIGYFAEQASDCYPQQLRYLGCPANVIPFVANNQVEHIYCGPSSTDDLTIASIIDYCENHLIHFFSIPNTRYYLKRRMYLSLLENIPVLSIRPEPLSATENRLLKRLFDIVFSLLFLCTLFPIIYIIIGTAIKITSPGPVFFKQKRSGEDGKDFWCYKFRSMRVNVDCDKIQATKNDPRKTCLGEFMRKTNIDELPQFINVLRGDMSVVGPRPHMLQHTREYSKRVDKYMVRHLVKPGVTGWAQVTGYRGETREIWQMEGRVERDIWYLEHWTFMLDVYIIFRTVKNVLRGDQRAY